MPPASSDESKLKLNRQDKSTHSATFSNTQDGGQRIMRSSEKCNRQWQQPSLYLPLLTVGISLHALSPLSHHIHNVPRRNNITYSCPSLLILFYNSINGGRSLGPSTCKSFQNKTSWTEIHCIVAQWTIHRWCCCN